ncbi:MAG: 5-oxoprolinase subunit PxpA [Candidatus Marinimicrobia bacterium]|nr:5-oxoprolinase subunit PxpA [Candidatus Neomarinimicrobiota bacterium]MBL7010389.1 5-oxoprolinase subunit PxpA [Candidatus Neomarinimicrobiota bacterium]MBL7030850.1 5-oxoprolinase subunit PxpA [Candidatus Neomarinimicrobiota bacterium]
MDLNADMGEITRLLDDGTYEKLMNYVTSINVACGGHAGDEAMMKEMIRLGKEKGVNVGAHPGYPDKENFGRIDVDMDQNELLDSVRDQIQILVHIAKENGVALSHVKPHGALYNCAVNDETIAQTIGEAIIQVDSTLKVMGLAGSKMLTVFKGLGLKTLGEAFADRTYESDGTLRNRKYDDALITDHYKAALQAEKLCKGTVISLEGKTIEMAVQTICIHSDTPNAVAIAEAVRKEIN